MADAARPDAMLLDRWANAAARISWRQPAHVVYEPGARGGRWFPGATLNAAENCVDRHLPELANKVALYMGLLPETVVAMLACARLGAVHALLASAMPADALADRLADFEPKLLVTQDGAWRHGLILPLKARADEAITAGPGVEHTVVVRRTGI